MAKITIEEKDWERMQKSVKKHDEEITRLRQKVQPSSIDITSTPPNLTSLQSDIFRFVSEHPHCNKADVIDYLKDKGSRATVFKAIDILVEYGLILDGINEINRQTHSLVVNNDSELSLLIQELRIDSKRPTCR